MVRVKNEPMNEETPILNEYEELRRTKIAKNEAHLKKLGLGGESVMQKEVREAEEKKKTKAEGRKKKSEAAAKADPTRKSSRRSQPRKILNVSAWGDHDEYDPLDEDYNSDEGGSCEEEDGGVGQKKRAKKSRVSLSPPKVPKASDLERVTEEMSRFQSSLDSIISSTTSKPPSSASETECRALSLELWGSSCSPPPGCTWSTFLNSRLSTPSPSLPTQYALMQERYAHDGWRLLCACVLMSRCNSGEVKEKCITGFFKLCQTPSDFGDVNPEKLRKTVHSLGFQVDRVRAVAAVTEAWLTRGNFSLDLVPVEKGGNKILFAGPFTVDSYYLFAKGDKKWKMHCDITDVVWFQRWLKDND